MLVRSEVGEEHWPTPGIDSRCPTMLLYIVCITSALNALSLFRYSGSSYLKMNKNVRGIGGATGISPHIP